MPRKKLGAFKVSIKLLYFFSKRHVKQAVRHGNKEKSGGN